VFTAIWDTGASGTVITQYVVDKCGLKPTGMTRNHTAAGTVDAETFLVNAQLINGVGFMNLRVIKGQLPPGAHALIGMDIITRGDLAITNTGEKTILSFRTPSQVKVDVVEELNRKNARATPKFRPGPPRKKGRR
jgi:predicted aspartyl protease